MDNMDTTVTTTRTTTRLLDKFVFEPINLIEAGIIMFLGIALILAIYKGSTDVAYGISGAMAGYVGANVKGSITKRSNGETIIEVDSTSNNKRTTNTNIQ